ncbi:MAG: ATP-dependent Clp protease adaptor ClpS [Bacteroidota bacterium]
METTNFDKEQYNPDTEFDVLTATEEVEVEDKQIILYNDDFNTFDFVIQTLVKICKHEPIQAEQCAYLVHHKGKCAVKKGSYNELEPICTALLERGLTAEIE